MATIKVNDITIHYSERGEGTPALALHAATADNTSIGWLAHAIKQEGFNVLTPDQRGHGETANPAGDIHMARMAEDMLELLYLLGRDPAHAAGFSMGGAVALYAALRHPEFFRSLILLGTSYHAPTPERLETILGPVESRTPEQQMIFDPDHGVVVGWDAPLLSFAAITCPTLIICGDRDEYNDPEDSLALYRTLPNAELVVIPHCTHLDLVRHPIVYLALRDFFARVPR